jgi:hypothetical protein
MKKVMKKNKCMYEVVMLMYRLLMTEKLTSFSFVTHGSVLQETWALGALALAPR